MRVSVFFCCALSACASSLEKARARIDSLPREISSSRVPPSPGACNDCSAGTFTQLVNCLTSTNVCVTLTKSFSIIDPIEIAIPSYTYIRSPSPSFTLSGNGRQLFLVKNIDATLVLDNINVVAGLNEFSGYQGGGGAVQVTAGNFTAVSTVFAASVSYQQSQEVDIGGGAVSCMDQANTLGLIACAFLDNTCIGCSGGAVFSSCATYIGETEFFNNSIVTGTGTPVSGNAIRVAQVGNFFVFSNNTVYGNGITSGAASLPALSLSATAGTTAASIGNTTFADNFGGCLGFATDNIGSPTFLVQVGNSSFQNCTTATAAGGAITSVITSGLGSIAIVGTTLIGNIGLVGGAISIVDGNETNTDVLYLDGNNFACNGALYGVGNAINNGDTKDGVTVKTMYSVNNNFFSIKDCPPQTVLGPCQGEPGQCPTK